MNEHISRSQHLILIIDDNPTNIKLVQEYLTMHDFSTIVARDGEMGLKRAKFSRPDLILLDVLMPEMNGFEVCRRLKADEETNAIPVIFMTVKDHVEDKVEGFEAGGVDYITKPAQQEEVLARVRTHVQLQEQQRRLQQQTQELEVAKRVAEQASQIKSTFLANMSHELRSPLTAILGFAQVLVRDRRLDRDQREFLSIITRSGEHLLSLLNQVLDISKIEAGRVTLNTKNVDLYHLLDEIEDMFTLKAKHKHLHLLFERDDTVPQYIRTDDVKLRQILINLLNNAVKFTQEGGVTLRIANCELRNEPTPQPSQEGKSEIRNLKFEISDTGPGIAPEEMDKLFEAFGQTESGRHTHEGTGLGLPISRKFAQVMGGDIQVKSEPGRGTTFTCDIQANIVSADEIEDVRFVYRRAIALEPGQPRYRILVVDDKQDNRQLLIKLLNPFGFELQEAQNGQETIRIWNTWPPHLIWMDLRMPIMDGYAATREIRRAEEKPTPDPSQEGNQSSIVNRQSSIIIALTSSGDEDERAVALSAGCDDFLHKPFKAEDIFDMLHTHLGVRFVYEEGKRQTANGKKQTVEEVLTPEALATLPVEWLDTLKQGARRADFLLLSSVIAQIRVQDARLAGALAWLAEDFKYDEILAILQQTEG